MIVETFGLTESCGGIAYDGRLLAGTRARVDAEGAIELHGPTVMEGYRHDPQSTADAFTLDGWLRTGDVGAIAREARDLGLAGVNVTHPCKQLVVPELDELSHEAAALNAVNTVVFDGDRMVGHNTDTTGFQEAFRRGLETVALETLVGIRRAGADIVLSYWAADVAGWLA